ncbi:MAG TPA: hypothetical protein VKU90_08235 [Caulobacteraceae bacterium]|nr:hypothetical protein [Caulobacteraceae bacterium]
MKIRSALAALLLLAFGAGAAHAQSGQPLKMSLDFDGTLYPFNLVPVKVLVVHADGRATPGGYESSVSMKSYGILRALKKVDIDAQTEGHVGRDGQAYPNAFTYVHHDGKRVRRVHVTWGPGVVQMVSTPPFVDLGQPPASLGQRLASVDPLTQFVRVANAADAQAICRGPDQFFDGKQLYQLSFGRVEPAQLTPQMKALGITRVAQCTVHYTEIAGFKAKPPKDRQQGLTSPITMVFGQVGQTGPWVIANIHASTVIGYADIVLRRITVTGERPRA